MQIEVPSAMFHILSTIDTVGHQALADSKVCASGLILLVMNINFELLDQNSRKDWGR